MTEELSDLARKLLNLLLRWRCIGGRYRPKEKLMKALKISKAELDTAIKELANAGFVIFHRKYGENIPSLDPHKVQRIRVAEEL